MRRSTLICLLFGALILTFALDASAIEKIYQGKIQYSVKADCDDCEDRSFRRFRFRKSYRKGTVDTTGSVVAVIQLDKGRSLTISVDRQNNRNGKFQKDADEAVDQTRAANFLNSYGLNGMVEVTRVKKIRGFQKILGKRFNKNRSEGLISGEYRYLDGPDMGLGGKFKFEYEMKKGKELPF